MKHAVPPAYRGNRFRGFFLRIYIVVIGCALGAPAFRGSDASRDLGYDFILNRLRSANANRNAITSATILCRISSTSAVIGIQP
jgi:hypothetical protein